MTTTVDALKALYAALGGSADTVSDLVTTPDVINAIASHVASGGAAELPKVSSTNNGQVLTVVNGEWAAAELPD